MMATFTIKSGDTSPGLEYTLSIYSAGSGVLAGASARFLLRRRGNEAVIIDAPAIIHDPDGVLRYAWQAGDTAASATYEAEFEIAYSDGSVETFPASDYIIVNIVKDIG